MKVNHVNISRSYKQVSEIKLSLPTRNTHLIYADIYFEVSSTCAFQKNYSSKRLQGIYKQPRPFYGYIYLFTLTEKLSDISWSLGRLPIGMYWFQYVFGLWVSLSTLI